MRYVSLATRSSYAILTALLIVAPAAAQGLSITNYQFVNEVRVTRTTSNVTYRADLVNPGAAVPGGIMATFKCLTSNVVVVPGSNTLWFSGPVPSSSQVTSSNTFTILVDRSVPFDFASLQWSFTAGAPVANAGPDQTVKVKSTVALNGSGSTNPSGIGTLTYAWSFVSVPSGSAAAITNPASAMAGFVVDAPGVYQVMLTVSNGVASSSAVMTVSTINSPPVANAGANQTVKVGTTVVLNGSGSSDIDGNPLSYAWTLQAVPSGSAAALSGAKTVSPTFVVDKPGVYQIQLIVNDGTVDSNAAMVTVTTENSAPVANPGANQSVNVNALVQLDGSASTDVDGDALTYSWSLISRPAGSSAALSSATAVKPAFTADVAGTYTAQLVVSDGKLNSNPATVTITTNAVQPPTANAGANQTVTHPTAVNLSGSGTDPQSLQLTYRWSLTTIPAGSIAILSNPAIAAPKFTADKAGTYVAQLIVNNGYSDSSPSTVTITTTNTAPVANPGSNQTVTLGATVLLDGSQSSDANNDPLTYAWSLSSRPTGSNASLTGANSAYPSFGADVAGVFVVQLIVNDSYGNSDPKTVTITVVGPPTISLGPNPLTVGTNAKGTLTLTLSAPAGSGGQAVSLVSTVPTVATVPSPVMVPAGATGINIEVTPGTVGSTTITAAAAGFTSASVTVNVVAPAIYVTPDSSFLSLSNSMNVKVTLSAPAPAGGIYVIFSGTPNNILGVTPDSVTIPGGATTTSFTVTGLALGTGTVTAASPGYPTGSASITVITAGNITLGSGVTLAPGQTAPISVTLDSPAPAGGLTIALKSSDSNVATIPASVVIAAGALTANPAPIVTGVNYGTATITATASGYNSGIRTVQVTDKLTFSPGTLTIPASDTQNLTLSLGQPAPSTGLVVTLSSDATSVATVPATVTIPAGTKTAQVAVTGVAQGSATVHASAAGVTEGTSLIIVPQVFGNIVLPANTTVPVGGSASFPVRLSAPAPANGTTITLTSDTPANVTISPASVFIAANAIAPATNPQVSGLGLKSAVIKGTASGWMADSQVVQVTTTGAFSPASATFKATNTQDFTLTLAVPAPAGGLTFNVTSSDPAVAKVSAATAVIAAGAKTATITVTGVAKGTAVIHASALPNVPDTTAAVTVQALGAISLPAGTVLGSSQSAAFPVTLSVPAPTGGVVVTLASGDPTIATIAPLTVTIPAGATTPVTQPQVTGAGAGTTTITASAPGFDSDTQSVKVKVVMTLTPANLTITGASTQNLTLTLSSPAPSGGLNVLLNSSNAAVASVPASVNIPGNGTTISVPVKGVSVGGPVIITASATNIDPATAAVTVQGDFILQAVTLGVGDTASFPVTLSAPAGSGGVFVTLTSSDPSKVTVQPTSILISQGGTVSNQPKVTGVATGSATITVSASGLLPASQQVQVTAPLSIAFTPNTGTVGVTTTQNLTLTLSAPAPVGGISINLSSYNRNVATTPPNVMFAAGATTVAVPVTGIALGTAEIHASALPNIADVSATVTVVTQSVIVPASPVTVALGGSAPFAVSLSQAASADVTISLASSDATKVSVSPATVVVLKGATTPASMPQVTGTGPFTPSAVITASAPGYSQGQQTVVVTPPVLTLSSTSLTVGTSQNLTVTVTPPLPAGGAGLPITFTSGDTSITTVAGTVTIPAGSGTATVQVNGIAAGGPITITAKAPNTGIANATGTVTVTNLPVITVGAVTTALGGSAPFTITLSSPAAADVTINLASSDAKKVSVPASVVILKGATTPATQPQATGVSPLTPAATITATATGYTQGQNTATVTPPVITLSSASVTVGSSQNLTVTMVPALPAGADPLSLTFTSGDTSTVTVAGTATIPAGSGTATVQVNGLVIGGPVTITAVAPGTGIANATGTVTVVQQPTITLGTITAPLGGSAPFTVTLSSPAAADVTVTLASSDANKASVPTSVLILKGQTAPAAQPQVNGVSPVTPAATITASAPGYTGTSKSAQVTASMNFPAGTQTVPEGATNTVVLTLSAPAPTGGLAINLTSSDPAAVSLPQTPVTILAGATTVNVPIKGMAQGTSATITAATAQTTTVANATMSVNVTVPLTITVPSSVTVAPGQSADFAVSLSQAASADTTVSLSADNGNATVPASVVVLKGATTPATQPKVQGVTLGKTNITASATGYQSGVGVANVSIQMNLPAPPQSVVAPAVLNLTLTLSAPATSGLTVNLVSSNPSAATVPATVTFTAGSATATVPVTGVAAGSTVITASATNSTNATTTVTVTGPANIVLQAVTVAKTQSAAFPVTLDSPAPADVTIALASGDTSKVTISPTTVTILKNATAPVTQPQVTGVDYGSASITATATGYKPASQTVTVPTPIQIQLPSSATTFVGSSTAYAVTLASAAPADVTINLVSSDLNKVTISPASVVILKGATAPAAQPMITGISPVLSAPTITATATTAGYAPATQPVTVQMVATFSGPQLVFVNLSTTLTLTLSAPAPAGGLTFNIGSSAPGVASALPATVIFAATATTATVTVTGVSAGAANITATVVNANIAPAIYAVTVGGSLPIHLSPSSATVGQNLQVPLTVSIDTPAPAGGLSIKLTSSDPSKLLVSGRQVSGAAQQVTFSIPEGTTSIAGIYLVGLANSGTVPVTASNALGYSGSMVVTLGPSGFILTGPNGIGSTSFSTNAGVNSTLTLYPALLNASNGYLATQEVRGATASEASYSVSLTVASAPITVGTILTPTVTFTSGDSSATTQFHGVSAGAATVTESTPSGFTTPSSGASLSVTVSAAGCTPGSVTVGQNLQTTATTSINGTAGSGGVTVHLTSNDASTLKLSTTASGAGQASIDVLIPSGQNTSVPYYVQGFASAGSVGYSCSATNFTSGTGTVTLTPGGFVLGIAPDLGNRGIFKTPGQTATFYVYPVRLESNLTIGELQPLAGGLTASVNVTSSNTTVGTVTTSPVNFTGGQGAGQTGFLAAAVGTTTLTVSQPASPAGFSTPAVDTTLTAQVAAVGMFLCDANAGDGVVGNKLQQQCTVGVGANVPSNVVVTITSNDPLRLKLAANPTDAGSAVITVTIPTGQSSATYYVQGFDSTGTATHTATASGYASETGTIAFFPSGVVMPKTFGFFATIPTPVNVTLSTAMLNADGSFYQTMALAGGTTLNVTTGNTFPAFGTFPASVTFTGGTMSTVAQFVPVSPGTTTLSVNTPPGWTTPASRTSLSAIVSN
jgi:trimeric autotransporter adhesin